MNKELIYNSNYVLRKILNKEENLDIVKKFIEDILRIKINKIILRSYIECKERYLPPEEKYGIVNVRIQKEDGEELNVGIQFVDGPYIQEEILIYGASIHVNQTEYEDNCDIVKTITINILDFELFSTPAYHKIIKFFQRENEEIKIKDAIEFQILELPKFKEKILKTKEQEWLAYLQGEDVELMKKAIESNEGIKKIDELLQIFWKKDREK